jgi:hypothetical protein
MVAEDQDLETIMDLVILADLHLATMAGQARIITDPVSQTGTTTITTEPAGLLSQIEPTAMEMADLTIQAARETIVIMAIAALIG